MAVYGQRTVVSNLHSIPRFGHSNRIADVASDDSAERTSYINGIIAFIVFVAFLSFVWVVVLIALKFSCGKQKVGCAAGGGPVHVSELKANGVHRKQRKRRIVRNWRVQTVFLLCCMLIPALSFLFVNHGLHPFLDSLDQVDGLTARVREESVAGSKLANKFMRLRDRLQLYAKSVNLDKHCPNLYDTEGEPSSSSPIATSINLDEIQNTVENGIETVNAFVDQHAPQFAMGLSQVTEGTLYVEEKVDVVQRYDWLIQGFLIALNVLNVFLFVGAILTRNSVFSPPYQTLMTWFVVPAFCAFVIATVVATCVASTIAIANADFCAGGASPGSPQGTFEELLEERGFTESDLAYEALQYYASECDGPNPLSFLYNVGAELSNGKNQLSSSLQAMAAFNASTINDACGADTSSLVDSLSQIEGTLTSFETSLTSASNLTSCSNLEPIFRQTIHGAPCSQSVSGMAWLFGTTLGMTVVGLVMLSLRAALYNPVLKPRRVKRREREFREYKEYMGDFYDTSGWEIDPLSSFDNDMDALKQKDTFETEESETSISSPHQEAEPKESVHPYWDDQKTAEGQTVSSTQTTVSRIVATAVTLARDGLSTFNQYEPDIEYYSSSDSEDDNETEVLPNNTSVAPSEGAGSQLSELVSRFFVVKRTVTCDEEDASTMSKRTGPAEEWHGPVVPPAFLTPRRRRTQQQRFSWNSGGSFSANGMSSKVVSTEMKPLTPSSEESSNHPDVSEAPRKSRKALGRTRGGSKLKE